MERTPVTSTDIRAIGCDADSQTLEIEFNSGSVYDYAGVPQGEYDGFMGADSKGKYFHANIKNRYSFVKL
ncbi:MAG: KTSC domain-containing protein [Gammaproteobacteria bacterium]|nr:KTSC domain-containing protein [Gammaproteobacteria bacterium]